MERSPAARSRFSSKLMHAAVAQPSGRGRAHLHLAGTGRPKRREWKNGQDAHYAPVSYDIRREIPARELVETAAYIHMDLEEAGFSQQEVAEVADVLKRLAETVSGGLN